MKPYSDIKGLGKPDETEARQNRDIAPFSGWSPVNRIYLILVTPQLFRMRVSMRLGELLLILHGSKVHGGREVVRFSSHKIILISYLART